MAAGGGGEEEGPRCEGTGAKHAQLGALAGDGLYDGGRGQKEAQGLGIHVFCECDESAEGSATCDAVARWRVSKAGVPARSLEGLRAEAAANGCAAETGYDPGQ